MIRRASAVVLCSLLASVAFAGGPLTVGSPTFGTDAQPFVFDNSAPINYTIDSGPMAVNGTTVVIDNTTGRSRVAGMFGQWHGVSTANITFKEAGFISGGDVATVAQFNSVETSCTNGQQSPVIFDANGSIMKGLGLDDAVIGFGGPCAFNATTGKITTARLMMNGKFQDKVDSSSTGNYELTSDEFDQAITHEIGHFIGLDHSQINLNTALGTYPCPADGVSGMPLMFPLLACQSRTSAGFSVISTDDAAWVSKLYPAASLSTTWGKITGYIYFSDGVTHVEGANVIARLVDDPSTPPDESQRTAVSVVSGYLFTGNPGQSVTAKYLPCNPASKCPGGFADNNSGGSNFGSRNATLIGYYEIPVPPGTYTVEVQQIFASFTGGSSVGPLDPPVNLPGPEEFWNQNESATDDVTAKDPITVSAGQTVSGINIILNHTAPRFDQFETGVTMLWDPPDALIRRKHGVVSGGAA